MNDYCFFEDEQSITQVFISNMISLNGLKCLKLALLSLYLNILSKCRLFPQQLRGLSTGRKLECSS